MLSALNCLSYKVFEELGGGNRPVLDDTGKNLIVRRVLEKEKEKAGLLWQQY